MKKNTILGLGIVLTLVAMTVSGREAGASRRSADPKNGAANLKLDTVVTGLKMPWAMAFLPDGRILVTERTGELRLVEDGKLNPTPVKGVPKVIYKGQGGLLDVVLHPDYEKNGWIYISYSAPGKRRKGGANTALLRGKLRNGELVEQQKLFKAKPDPVGGNHFAGRIAFDKKGHVFLTVGERGQKEKAQDLTTHQGKVIRLNEDGSIPDDNPFVGKKSKSLPEIYSYGHRNMQGLAIHPVTGAIWEHEHGPQGGDEVNIVEKGKNYGWPLITFGVNYDDSIISKDTAQAGMEQPVIYWKPSIAPCGMTFVHSDKFKDWEGDLIVGSLKFAYLKHCVVKGNKIVSQETLFEGIGRVRDVRQGPDGYIYVVLENSGKIVRITPGS